MAIYNNTAPNDGLNQFISNFINKISYSDGRTEIIPVPSDGSARNFWRIFTHPDHPSFIAMENSPSDDLKSRENDAYLRIGAHLYKSGVPVPQIYRSDLNNGWFIMEDFGESNLQSIALQNYDNISLNKKVSLYKKVVEILFKMQIKGQDQFDRTWTCQTETYDLNVMKQYESDYFLNECLNNYFALKIDKDDLLQSFDYIAKKASLSKSLFFIHRDFQSRNIMINEPFIGILDWQGGRIGPLGYDLASLLIDPYVGLTMNEQKDIYDHYKELLLDYDPELADSFDISYTYLAIQRNLQILGAFSFLSNVRGKPFFKDFIKPALLSLNMLLRKAGDSELSDLMDITGTLIPVA